MADLNFVPNTAGASTFRGVDGAGSGIIQEVVRVSWGPNTAENLVNTGGGALPVQDGGNSLTVDGTVSVNALPAGTNNIGDVDVVTLPALPAGTNNIGDVDVLSVVPGTGATNLGKAEDAVHTSGDTGVMALTVRSDAGGSLVGASGDYSPL
ncbi:MAG: hypothetical protein L0Y56_04935, partial [Nitrospira sp.]|nr:hypothetical protein [Nitrospira sp.]